MLETELRERSPAAERLIRSLYNCDRRHSLKVTVDWCIENPLEGEPLPDGDPRMKALAAYLLSEPSP